MDGQALAFRDGSFDGVLCQLGLMFFPDPLRGLAEFRRVLRPGRCAAVCVISTADRALNDTAIVICVGGPRAS
jgi:ubiquinone/menaquinone biosynthesis C-methylase UbiE